jgi:hypothetical protein
MNGSRFDAAFSVEPPGGSSCVETLADTIRPVLRDDVTVATAGTDLLILNIEANQVMRLTCANASAGDIIDTLGTHGLLDTSDGQPPASDPAASTLSRRRMLQGAAAAGVVGVTTLTLPTSAMAASVGPSSLAAPTAVTATATADAGSVEVAWAAVAGATDYQVYRKLTSQDASNWVTYGSPVTASPVTVTGLSGTVSYDFHVVAIAGADQSAPSSTATATPAGGAGITWTARTAAASNIWRSVTYGEPSAGGLFVAVTTSGTNRVMTSLDGITWTAGNAATPSEWESVTYGNGLFVAVGWVDEFVENDPDDFMAGGAFVLSGRVMTSPDGITWTSRSAAADSNWKSVTYGNGLFVAVAFDGTGNRVMTSPDGITWTARTAAAASGWYGVTYGMIDSSVTSTASGTLVPGFVAVANGGTNRVMTSPDGITWTARTAAEASGWNSVTYGDGLFVAVANGGTNKVMTSPDGITWTSLADGASFNWLSVTYGNGLFVAVAVGGTGNRVMTSPDGITWTPRAAAPNTTAWFSVAHGSPGGTPTFVAVGTRAAMSSP